MCNAYITTICIASPISTKCNLLKTCLKKKKKILILHALNCNWLGNPLGCIDWFVKLLWNKLNSLIILFWLISEIVSAIVHPPDTREKMLQQKLQFICQTYISSEKYFPLGSVLLFFFIIRQIFPIINYIVQAYFS